MRSEDRRATRVSEGFRARLEARLMDRHAALYGAGSAPGRRRWRRSGLLMAAAILIATAAIANVPVKIAHSLGHVVTVDLPAGLAAPDRRDLMLHLLDAKTSATGPVSVSVGSDERGSHVLLLLFAAHLDPVATRTGLERAFPALARGSWRVRAMETDLETTLAGMLAQRLFAIEADPDGLERGRRLVLDHLASEGRPGRVTFRREVGIRVIEVESSREREPEPGSPSRR